MKKLVAVVALLVAAVTHAQAQSYPSRQITLIVPFPPGGSTDTAARIMAERMRPILGQPIVIENVGGAGGSIGVGRVARAAPDGYTIDIGQWDTHVGSIIYPLTYDLAKDFAPIGLMTINPQLLIARKAFPADDLKGLVAWAKANPGKGTLVDQNAGAKVGGIQFMQATGTKLEFIPFRGAGPAMQAMIAGQVDLMILQAAAVMPQARAGTIKVVANLSPNRSRVLPDVQTSDEGGVPGGDGGGGVGPLRPAPPPGAVIAKLNAAMVDALADPALQKRFADLGLDIAPKELQSPQGLARFHKAETDKWWPVIKTANIKVE